MTKTEEILKLKKEKDVVILAHYYVDGEVQDIADFVGDSYFLAKKAKSVENQNILFCGVSFMGESAKILNPTKNVMMANSKSDCPMAHMVDMNRIAEVRKQYPDVAVVCYVNSTAEIKEASDVCVTSSNAIRIVEALENEHIFFIPDGNLARFIANQVPDKKFIFNDGYCHVHNGINVEDIERAQAEYPNAQVLTHPECRQEIVDISDFVGSTSEIIDYATATDISDFIVCTEIGVFHELKKRNPNKNFHAVKVSQICPNMKRITIEDVLDVLSDFKNEVIMDEELRIGANAPLERMLELAK